MPFIQNRNAFLQSQGNDGRPDVGDGGEKYYPGPSRGAGPSSSGHRLKPGDVTPPLPGATPEDPLAGALLGLAENLVTVFRGCLKFQFSVTTKLVIAHPCMVLRRQCQVHQNARSLHLTPFTLVPVVCNMVANEGILTFWKGSIGSCVLWGLSNVTEIVFADLFGLPRHVVVNGSSEKYWKHILLKA
ncbi:unnamed protein product [Strongylus vulgaris]|uniref:Uncharacterized protein n=1 Tax=Strongylus vulgaris TaxID=40348 RepID=A0A3P7LAD9_STRVU|nr:unnamed protein product [Strongylus vulgaris]